MSETNHLHSHTGMAIQNILDALTLTQSWHPGTKNVVYPKATADKMARILCGIPTEEMRPEFFIA